MLIRLALWWNGYRDCWPAGTRLLDEIRTEAHRDDEQVSRPEKPTRHYEIGVRIGEPLAWSEDVWRARANGTLVKSSAGLLEGPQP